MSYNLNENTEDEIEIILNGKKYKMRLATVQEIEDIQKMAEEKQNDAMYEYVDTTEPDQTPFKDEIKKCNIRVIKRFGEMLKKEFSVED